MATSNAYTDIAANQKDGKNFLGGGLTTQPGQLNDPVTELGTASMIIATYTVTSGDASGDVLYIARLPAGTYVDPQSTVANNGAATTAYNFTIGDTDTVGGTVSADASRYSANMEIHAATTTVPTSFTGGTVLQVPAATTDDGCWVTATLGTITTPTAGAKIVFRLKVSNSR